MIITVFSSGICSPVKTRASVVGYAVAYRNIGAPVGGFTGGTAGGGVGGGGVFVPGGGGLLGGGG